MQEGQALLNEVVVRSYSLSNISSAKMKKQKRKNRLSQEDVERKEERISTVENGISVEFKIKKPYSIKKDGKAYSVKLDEYTLPASYEYYCAPKLDPSAFLTANVSGWESYNLLSGQANLFYEGTYLGKSFLDASEVEDTLSISLGRDQNIVVKRERNLEFNKKKLLALKRTDYRAWKIDVKNKKKLPIKILIEDQFPISTEAQIEIDLISYKGGELDKESNIVSWNLAIEPGGAKEVELQYSVKYPKHKKVYLE